MKAPFQTTPVAKNRNGISKLGKSTIEWFIRRNSGKHLFTDKIDKPIKLANDLEVMLVQAGLHHGKIERPGMPFCPSVHLKQLRHRRRHENSQDARKTLNLRIGEVCRCELRSSKSRQLAPYLSNSFMWKTHRASLPRPLGQQCTYTNDEFAPMLEAFSVGRHRTWCFQCA